jgi:hypothetical protein
LDNSGPWVRTDPLPKISEMHGVDTLRFRVKSMSEDPVMIRITAAMEQLHSGDRAGAQRAFAELWSEMGDTPDPFHVCTLSHYMADTQDDVRDELEWDLRALDAAGQITDERATKHHASLAIKSFYPSLYLNVADAYFRLRDFENARQNLGKAQSGLHDLPDSPLASMIRDGIERLAHKLGDVDG